MVKIGSIKNETGGQININDMRTIQIPIDLIEKIDKLEKQYDPNSSTYVNEAKGVGKDIVKSVLVRVGAEKLFALLASTLS